MLNPVFSEILEVLNVLTKNLNNLRIDYFIGGSFASGIRGEFRATQDIDIVARIIPEKVDQLVTVLQKDFYADELSIPKAISNQETFNIIHNKYFIKVDIFTKIAEFEEDQFKRATKIKVPNIDLELLISSAEDIILSKLRWYQSGGCISERQLNDIQSVLKFNSKTIDYNYLKVSAQKMGLLELLDKQLPIYIEK